MGSWKIKKTIRNLKMYGKNKPKTLKSKVTIEAKNKNNAK